MKIGSTTTLTGPPLSKQVVPRSHLEGRRHDRSAVSAKPVTLLVKSEGQMIPYQGKLVDLTEQGIRIKASIVLGPGETAVIMPGEGPRYAVNGRVVWANKEEHEMGFELQNPAPPTCWDFADRTAATFRIPQGRRSARKLAKVCAMLVVDPRGDKKEYPCELAETSQGGMRIKTGAELGPGDVVDLVSDEGSWHSTRCRVVWVRGSDHDREVGLELLNPFSK